MKWICSHAETCSSAEHGPCEHRDLHDHISPDCDMAFCDDIYGYCQCISITENYDIEVLTHYFKASPSAWRRLLNRMAMPVPEKGGCPFAHVEIDDENRDSTNRNDNTNDANDQHDSK